MKYGYARVSTVGQAVNGNSLEEQDRVLRENGAELVFSDAYTGTKKDRPQLNRLLSEIGEGDTLLVTKLDRIARSLSQGVELINDLIEKGVTVHILNLGVMDSSPASKLIRGVMFSFAEFERDLIVERTMEGKRIAMQRPGYREGAERTVDPQVYKRLTQAVDAGAMTVKDAAAELGISRNSWYSLRRTDKKHAAREAAGHTCAVHSGAGRKTTG